LLWLFAALGFLFLLAALVVFSSVSTEVFPGIPRVSVVTAWGLPLVRMAADLTAVITIGFTLVASVLVPSPLRAAKEIATATAALWMLAVMAKVVFTLSDTYALELSGVLDPVVVGSFLGQIELGRVMVCQLALIPIATVIHARSRGRSGGSVALALYLVAAAVPAFSGHSGILGFHEVATATLMVHIGAVCLWVGGLVAVGWVVLSGGLLQMPVRPSELNPGELALVRSFSTMVIWCVTAVGVTGVVNALMRLGSLQQLISTTYGNLLLLKVCGLIGLVLLGVVIRRSLNRDKRIEGVGDSGDVDPVVSRKAFIRVLVAETILMALVLALSVTLARTDPVQSSPVQQSSQQTGPTAAE
jgi:putative copper export protein